MKKLNKKGFTIVELVIVIAVIAILASVMIPTFSGIVKKAQDSAAEQSATAKYHAALAYADLDNVTCEGWYIVDAENDYYFAIVNGQVESKTENNFDALDAYADIEAAKEAGVAAGDEIYLPLAVVEDLEGAAASEVAGVYAIYTVTEADLAD